MPNSHREGERTSTGIAKNGRSFGAMFDSRDRFCPGSYVSCKERFVLYKTGGAEAVNVLCVSLRWRIIHTNEPNLFKAGLMEQGFGKERRALPVTAVNKEVVVLGNLFLRVGRHSSGCARVGGQG